MGFEKVSRKLKKKTLENFVMNLSFIVFSYFHWITKVCYWNDFGYPMSQNTADKACVV